MTNEKIQLLLEEKEYSHLRSYISEQEEADVATLLAECDLLDMVKIFRLLPKDLAAKIFYYLPIELETAILSALEEHEAGQMINLLYADDAADLLEEMPAGVTVRLLKHTTEKTRENLNRLLQYPENSAGSIMTVEFLAFKQDLTVLDALTKIRQDYAHGVKRETIDTCYITDPSLHLLGTVSLHDLVIAKQDAVLSDIMNPSPIFLLTTQDRESVTDTFQKYDRSALPVVDSESRLVGIITTDDILDVIQEEATEDIEKMAAIIPSDKPYSATGVVETWKKRIVWLLLLMLTGTFTSAIIQNFEKALSSQIFLVAFIPMLMSTGGNAGGQSSVSVIRGLSLKEIRFSNLGSILWKEFCVGILSGLTLGIVGFLYLLIVDFRFHFTMENCTIALVISITLFVCVILAKLIGCLLPILAQRIGLDPAVMASPFITTLVDVLTLTIYFQIAMLLLQI